MILTGIRESRIKLSIIYRSTLEKQKYPCVDLTGPVVSAHIEIIMLPTSINSLFISGESELPDQHRLLVTIAKQKVTSG
jgi:hypothetical protein